MASCGTGRAGPGERNLPVFEKSLHAAIFARSAMQGQKAGVEPRPVDVARAGAAESGKPAAGRSAGKLTGRDHRSAVVIGRRIAIYAVAIDGIDAYRIDARDAMAQRRRAPRRQLRPLGQADGAFGRLAAGQHGTEAQ